MKLHRWSDIKAKRYAPEKIAQMKKAALDELLEMDLRMLREAAGLTQEELATKLEKGQGVLSKLESGGDHRLSTIRNYVEALGGEVEVIATVGGKRIKLAC